MCKKKLNFVGDLLKESLWHQVTVVLRLRNMWEDVKGQDVLLEHPFVLHLHQKGIFLHLMSSFNETIKIFKFSYWEIS